jgi:glucan phosphoethanolaminetransferase (alkaline phosphatase superfamily)
LKNICLKMFFFLLIWVVAVTYLLLIDKCSNQIRANKHFLKKIIEIFFSYLVEFLFFFNSAETVNKRIISFNLIKNNKNIIS